MAFGQLRAARGAATMSERGAARRRVHRSRSIYCSTNGCTSFLRRDEARGVARCPICGYERRLA